MAYILLHVATQMFLHAALHACVCRYSRESYLELVDTIHSIIPGVNIEPVDVRIHVVSRSSSHVHVYTHMQMCLCRLTSLLGSVERRKRNIVTPSHYWTQSSLTWPTCLLTP